MTKMTEMTLIDLHIALAKVKDRLDMLIISEVDKPAVFDERAVFIEMVEAANICIKHIEHELEGKRRISDHLKEFVWMGSWE